MDKEISGRVNLSGYFFLSTVFSKLEERQKYLSGGFLKMPDKKNVT